MLVLARKNRETIVIDGRITVKVLQIKGGVVRLGIEAPGEVGIRRGELEAPPAAEREAVAVAGDEDWSQDLRLRE